MPSVSPTSKTSTPAASNTRANVASYAVTAAIFSAASPGCLPDNFRAAIDAAVTLSAAMLRPRWGSSAGGDPWQFVRGRACGLLGAALALGCASTPLPCRSPSVCPTGSECLAHRCEPIGAEPVARDSQRRVLEPVDIAVVHGDGSRGGLPPTVTLGGAQGQS